MIATGSFKARACTPISWIKSEKSGTQGAEVTFRLLEGPDAQSTLKWVGWMSDKTLVRTQEALALMGFDGENEATVQANDVLVVIDHEEYTKADNTVAKRARIQWINDPAGGSRFATMDAAQVSGAKERLRAAALAAKKPAAAIAPEDEPKF